MIEKKVIVIGAGVIGTTTALELLQHFSCVTLLADKFDDETTSDGAAGIFRPSTSFLVDNKHITEGIVRNSYAYYSSLVQYQGSGVKPISGYILSKTDPLVGRNYLLESLLPEFRAAERHELEMFGNQWKFGVYFKTLLIECRSYLPWARSKFLDGGGRVVRGTVNKIGDVRRYGTFNLVVNCTGFGAKSLCNDTRMVPISGQVFKVKADYIKNFVYADLDTYIIPGYLATIGGSRHYESARSSICEYDGEAIWSRAVALEPRLRREDVIRQWVGVRPHRDGGVRIEKEIVDGLKVVHNYGHGGYGVTTAPGSALHAVSLSLSFFMNSKL